MKEEGADEGSKRSALASGGEGCRAVESAPIIRRRRMRNFGLLSPVGPKPMSATPSVRRALVRHACVFRGGGLYRLALERSVTTLVAGPPGGHSASVAGGAVEGERGRRSPKRSAACPGGVAEREAALKASPEPKMERARHARALRIAWPRWRVSLPSDRAHAHLSHPMATEAVCKHRTCIPLGL